jgi:hypothetical protein
VGAEPTDVLSSAVLGLAARGLTHPMLAGWLRTPHASFGGRRPADVYVEQPDLVFDIASLAARNDFRRGPRG